LSDGLSRFNAIPAEDAERRLYECFASASWARRVAAGRPYRSFTELLEACESAWAELAPDDWLAAFAAHARIGEKGGHAPQSSEREQSGVRAASPETMAEIAAENRRYESRFDHVFLIFASGRTGDEILSELRRRIGNDPATEVAVAADEHRKITRVRLERMLNG
jgi:OHCU decarboxylase